MQDQRRCRERRRRRIAESSRSRRSARLSGAPFGERLVSLGPDVLRRVEFGRVRREVVDVQVRVIREEGLNLPAAVDGAAIPEQVYRAAQVAE